MVGRWAETLPSNVAGWMADCTIVWWIAGGWALDLWVGRTTRAHSDLEIGCFQGDLGVLVKQLEGWELCVAQNKVLAPFDPLAEVPERPFSLWARRPSAELWDIEILPEEQAGARWVYRRDSRLNLPVSKVTVVTAEGVRVIAPEIQLLCKSKARRPKDRDDFEIVLPLLGQDEREWLRQALELTDPQHEWISRFTA